jgi:hypothetical protein
MLYNLHDQVALASTEKPKVIPIFRVYWTDCKEAPGSVVVKALCYKPEYREFDIRWGDIFFKCT